ncbi:conjugal transfer protein TraC (plasmid) [Vibrio harveyi]|nr:conjugal transfer protein TraC [Vibrio harveyi]
MNIITIRKKLQEKLIPEHLRAAGIVPVLAYSEDDYTFLMDDKSIGFGFYCHPLCGADEKIQERVNGFMNQEYPVPKPPCSLSCFDLLT